MRHHLGVGMQIAAMVFLPLLIVWQLEYGFRILYMPMLLLVGMAVFWLGTRLRES